MLPQHDSTSLLRQTSLRWFGICFIIMWFVSLAWGRKGSVYDWPPFGNAENEKVVGSENDGSGTNSTKSILLNIIAITDRVS